MLGGFRSSSAPLRWTALSTRSLTSQIRCPRLSSRLPLTPKATPHNAAPFARLFHGSPAFAQSLSGDVPATKFEELRGSLNDSLIDTITKTLRFETMTEVQSLTLHEAVKGQDILAQAKTGTGKTLAFLLPILQNLLKNDPELGGSLKRYGRRPKPSDIKALIISPTRELAEQIATEAKKLVQGTQIVVQTAVGGTQKSLHLRMMQAQGCHILVGTPGRLKDILSDPHTGVKTPSLNTLILDEADRLLDDGFWPEINEISKLLPDPSRQDRQSMLFSATMPREVVELARSVLKDDFHHVQTVNEDEEPTHERVPQHIVLARSFENYLPTILELCERELNAAQAPGSTKKPFKAIVYSNATAETVIASQIFLQMRMSQSSSSVWRNTRIFEIHSRLTQAQRTAAATNFRLAKSGILFSSDVTARGMDFPGVTHVIQIGLPQQRESYIHRIGRTARAGADGEGWLILAEPFLREARQRLGEMPLKRNDTLSSAKANFVDVDDGELPENMTETAEKAFRTIKESASRVRRGDFVKAYQGILGTVQSFRDKQWIIDALNRTATTNWGLKEPPGLSPGIISKMGLSRIHGIRVAQDYDDRYDSYDRSSRGGSRNGRPDSINSRGRRFSPTF